MTVKNKTNKNYKRSQKGRSMVEMLGVLAIVGVLSVGGVYGYGVAMKKHKANELLHQASMLATTISAQAMTNDGKLPETITSFGNSSYGTFSPSTTDALNGKGFTITISNMDSAVCEQMEKMAGGMVQGASCSGTTLTLSYYKNLATDPAEGEKSPTGGSGAGGGTPVDCSSDANACPGCQTCQDGVCKDDASQCLGGTCTNGSCICSDGRVMCGSAGCCGSKQLCGATAILVEGEDGAKCHNADSLACAKNSDCASGEYCKIVGEEESECGTFSSSSTACVATTSSDLTEVTYNGKKFYVGPSMSWWAAENFCLAHGKKLASLSSLGLPAEFGFGCQSSCKGSFMCYDYEKEDYVIQEEGSTCSSDSYDCIEYVGDCPLYMAFGGGAFWTSILSGPCDAFDVAIGEDKTIVDIYTRDISCFALCE